MARLTISAPDGKRGILELTGKPVVTIGRGNANDLVLNDGSVSRFHAVIKVHEDGVISIADRGSTNGVVVNGQRIERDAQLKDGDLARIGLYELRLESINDASLVVRKAEIPSTLNQVLQGRRDAVHIESGTPVGTLLDIAGKVKKLEHENYLLTVLYDAGKALNSKLSIDDISEQVMNLSFRIEGVERGFMMLFDKEGKVSRQTEVRYRRPPPGLGNAQHQPHIILSRSILERVRTELEPILISDVSGDDRFSGSESMKISGLRSAMCAPLVWAKQLFGILYVDNLERAAAFTQEEMNVFALVAAQAAAAIDNATTHQQLAEQAVQRSALERFLSPDVVELIAKNPEGVRLGGQNQKVSVMFADIRGFTALAEKMAPQRVVEILNEYFTRVTDVIFGNGGTLDKYIGDGVMAVFGAPISKGDDTGNAVRAAVEIQRLVVELNRDAADRRWPELRVGIGVNSGTVIAGNIGSPRRIDYTVVGDTVNVAARLMSNAAGGQIMISQATAAELGSQFQARELPPLTVKGKSKPLLVFEVVWENSSSAGTR